MNFLRRRFRLLAAGAALALAAAILIHKQSSPVATSDSSAKPPLSVRNTGRAETRPAKPLPNLPSPVESPHPSGSADKQDWIEKRISELDQLAWLDDSESLGKILAELRNPVPEIRAAALEATRAFGSREAIPHLDALSRDTKDPLEQKAIDDLIDHLKLPTLLEASEVKEDE